MTEKHERSVTRWDPFGDLGAFESWHPFREWPRFGRFLSDPGDRARGMLNPAIDIGEDEKRYVVTAELPGCSKDDITVELHDGVLTLRGEKRDEREEKQEQRRYVERTYGSFVRSFRLPANAGAHAAASFKDGVLTVEIAKAQEEKPKVISIE